MVWPPAGIVDVEIRVGSCGEQRMTPRLRQVDVDRRSPKEQACCGHRYRSRSSNAGAKFGFIKINKCKSLSICLILLMSLLTAGSDLGVTS